MAWWTCFKQWAVREFPVAKKESGTNTHKKFKTLHGVNAVDKRTVHQWVSLISGLEKGQVDLSDVTVFWDGKGVILVKIMAHGQTINSSLNTSTV
jgi:hypothetical protein